ncbi:hypothetical protein [Paenibacillus graminis]|uniref:hypothetical protein n=1 Tax=Paenibacillus graminis TaxID=189425 RepID=UPI000FA6B001|nr:hypothetical protein [Paenibacillus graminis]MEC0168813.1 hypothetical protein [Paenibacillus graminis]
MELRIKDTQATLGAAHDWGEFEVFRTAVGSNLTVSSALDAGLIQRVNGTSVEQNGFVLTVDGIAADQGRPEFTRDCSEYQAGDNAGIRADFVG